MDYKAKIIERKCVSCNGTGKYHVGEREIAVSCEKAGIAVVSYEDVFEPCKACGGTGKMEVLEMDRSEYYLVVCHSCKGRGRSERKIFFGLFKRQTTCRNCDGKGIIERERQQ